MTRSGDRLSRFALRANSNTPRMLSASQLGVTLASLGLGWVAGATLTDFAAGVSAGSVATEVWLGVTIGGTLALAAVAYLHVVFGGLTPTAFALNHPEILARWLAPPLLAFAWITTPFTFVLNRSSQLVMRSLGQKPPGTEEAGHSPEEIRLLVEQSQESG